MRGLNSHFVSRFLTTPWEHGDRRLSYFDFEHGELRQGSSRRLFAVTGGNTAEVERRLNQVVETPVSRAMRELVDGPPGPDELLEWPLFRAVSLLLMLQPLRPPGRSEHTARLEEIITRTDAELDELARAAHATYRLGRISVRRDVPVLYPGAGFFPLVARRRDDSYGMAIAIPAGVHHAFIAVPRSIDWDGATAQWAANGAAFIANMSVGTSAQVVIPPFAMEDDIGRVTTLIRQLRQENQQLIALCREHNDALERLNAAMTGHVDQGVGAIAWFKRLLAAMRRRSDRSVD